MKKLIPLLCLSLVCGYARSEDAAKDQVHPTGLTIVVMDDAAKVLDSVKVADDKKSYEITFKTSDATRKIKVVALGNRTDASLPKDVFITGKSKADLGGIGKVVVTIDEGKVISIKGDGFGAFVLTDEIRKGVLGDLKEGKQADLTLIEELVDDDGES
ncbi:hypothetical protein JIN84_00430 [Luteolibacter yonseiensis]|uniref:Uncharacterized protein n=1 Tax=Luteolibacter yonseiensis TaxID=1144680 RepID=A0A934V8F9_9BACT|nr:hypothetical protein [Luteolibacter yonseiensis]MBK1814073.1 hypothetical protein [Luteolibacter yonseiensis]